MQGVVSQKTSLVIVSLLALFSFFSFHRFQGSAQSLILFDALWLTALYLALYKPKTHVIFFITVMLFLGFFVKLNCYLALYMRFTEFLGYWNQYKSSSLWTRAIQISTIPAIALILINVITPNIRTRCADVALAECYRRNKQWMWAALFTIAIILNLINLQVNFYRIALPPKYILPFHLNAILPWLLLFCFPIIVGFMFNLELEQKGSISKPLIMIYLAIAALTAIIDLSRATYLFFTLPLLLTTIANHSAAELWKLAVRHKKIVVVFLLVFVISAAGTDIMRTSKYHQDTEIKKFESMPHTKTPTKIKIQRAALFPIKRWVGIEAVLATTAYPHGGTQLLNTAIFENPNITNPIGLYNSEILAPQYHNHGAFGIGFLPGVVGILNYAHSSPIILLGLLFIFGLAHVFELWVSKEIGSSLLCAQQGLITAYWCISGAIFPYLIIVNFIECCAVALCIIFVKYILHFTSKRQQKDMITQIS